MNIRRDSLKMLLAVIMLGCMAVILSPRSSASTTAAGADAAATFKAKCASCHGADGGGDTAAGKALKVKDLRSAEVQGLSDDQLYQIVANGKGKMPGYEKTLGADTCKSLVAYIRGLKK